MNRFLYKILKKQKEKEYRKYIQKHKDYIEEAFIEMVMCPDMDFITWTWYHVDLYEQRVQTHDDSKLSPEEFDAYRAHYYPVTAEEKMLYEEDFQKAWQHHLDNNRHHWQARQNDVCEDGKLSHEQMFDCLENILDWMAVGYDKGDRPYQYYELIKDEIQLPEAERTFIEKVIYQGIDKKYVNKEV